MRENPLNVLAGVQFASVVGGRNIMTALFRFIASGKIRAGDEEDAAFYIRESLNPNQNMGYNPIEGVITVEAVEQEEEQ